MEQKSHSTFVKDAECGRIELIYNRSNMFGCSLVCSVNFPGFEGSLIHNLYGSQGPEMYL